MGIQRTLIVAFGAVLFCMVPDGRAAEPGPPVLGETGPTAPAEPPAATQPPAVPPQATPPARPKVEPPLVAEGFVATVFASAPDIVSPASMCVSPEGNVFVGEDPYNTGAGTDAGLGRVRMCLDTDHDGFADRFTLFAEKINSPQGMCFVDGTLYVTHAPFLSAFRDTDGDGKSDTRDDLITGLGPEPQGLVHHVPSGVRMGIDGWLYISIGDKGIPGATGKDGTKVRLQGGGVVRVRPDGTDLQLFSEGQRNTYDVSVDPLLDVYTRDNTNDGNGWNSFVTLVQRGAHYGYPHLYKNYNDEVAPHIADYGGGSATGSVYVHDATWPGGWGHSLYTCDWVKGAVYRHQLTPDGAGYTLSSDDFLKCSDPTDLDIDGDGRFYAADWARRNWGASEDRGVVFRVVPSGYPATQPANAAKSSVPDFAEATNGELVENLASPRAVWRLAAQRQLLRRESAKDAIPALKSLIDSSRPLYARVAALFTVLQLQGSASCEALVAASDSPALREFALCTLADRQDVLQSAGARAFDKHLDDANPRVRVQAAIALGALGDPNVAPALLPLTADADVRVRHASLRALRRLGASDACLAVLRDPKAAPDVAEGAMRVLREMHDVPTVSALRSLLAESTDPQRSIALVKLLARLYQREGEWDNGWWSPWPETKGPYVKAVAWEQSPEIAAVIAERIGDANAEIAKVAIEQAGQYGIVEVGGALAKIALGESAIKADAVGALTKLKATDPAVQAALEQIAASMAFAPEQRADAVAALSKVEGPDGLALIIRLATALAGQNDAPAPVVDRTAAALGERRAEESTVPALETLARSKLAALRGAAAAALLRSDAPAAKQAVEKLYADGDTNAAEAVLLAVTRVPAEAAVAYVERIRPLLADKRNAVRHAAALALGYAGDATSVPALLKLAARAIDRTPAMHALSQIGPEKTSDDQILPVARFLTESAASLADSADKSAYTKALQGAEKFLQDKRIPADEVAALSTRLQMAGIISEFRVAGPIPAPTTDSFASRFAPEESPAGPFTAFSAGDKAYDWAPLKVTDVEGRQKLQMPDNSVQYFAATIDAKAAGPAILSVRSDDGIIVWVNGEKIHAKSIARAVAIAVDEVQITLNAGANTLLFRVNNISGGSGLAARIRYRVGEFEPGELAQVIKDRPADLERGKAVFKSLACAQCHTTNPEEPSRGPFIGDVGGKFDRNQLIESILRPNATIAQGFTTQRVVVADGSRKSELLGFVAKETAEELDIRDLTGKVTIVPKAKIVEHTQQPQSMMPQGLADGLAPDELASLVTYLETLKPKPQ